MIKKKPRESTEINASSMADIAFLLLIFFLVTTTIASDRGLSIRLPPKTKEEVDIEIKEKNIFKVFLNSNNQLLVEEQLMKTSEIKEAAKKFIMNNGRDPKSSDSPQKAVISLKTDRGTNYAVYIDVMDELKSAYNELRAEYMGLTIGQYLKLENNPSGDHPKYDDAKKAIPYRLSEAEPTSVGG